MSLSNDQISQFFIDQVTAQYRDLKADIKNELVLLRQSLENEFERRDKDVSLFKDSVSKDMTELKRFKWTLLGGASLFMILLEVSRSALEYYLMAKGER